VTDRPEHVARQYSTPDRLQARMELHRRFGRSEVSWQRWLFDTLDLSGDARLLELGCGTGRFWVENADRIPEGWDIVLSDASEGMLAEAKGELASLPHAFTFRQIDARQIPYQDSSFDAVMAHHMLYHVADRIHALHEIKRVLAPGGSLYAATNGMRHMAEIIEALRDVAGVDIESYGLSPEETFGLESGIPQLHDVFEQVRVVERVGELRVTEVEPYMAYVLSMRFGDDMTDDQVQRLARWAEESIARHGAIAITTQPGVLIAR
jgi:ubiquinone/menaquinone biosynthesis C-methylase UbiE